MAPFYGRGSTASRLEPLRGSSLLFTTKFPEIPGTHFIELGRMKGWVDLGATQWFWTRDPWIGKSSTLTTRPLTNFCSTVKYHLSYGPLDINWKLNSMLTAIYRFLLASKIMLLEANTLLAEGSCFVMAFLQT